jgi:hypothetical protein
VTVQSSGGGGGGIGLDLLAVLFGLLIVRACAGGADAGHPRRPVASVMRSSRTLPTVCSASITL